MTRSIVITKAGLQMGNFGSQYDYYLEDGTVVPARPADDVNKLKLTFNENIIRSGKFNTVILDYNLSPAVIAEIDYWIKEHLEGNVDVVLTSTLLLEALGRAHYTLEELLATPFRGIRMVEKKHKICSATKFSMIIKK